MKLNAILLCTLVILNLVLASNNDDQNEENNENISDISSDDEEDFPHHYFCYKMEEYKTGTKKGKSHDVVTLTVPPREFKRRTNKKNGAYFSCNDCQKEGHNRYAYAVKTGIINKDGIEELKLETLPEHECSPESTNHLIKQFSQMLHEAIGKDPTRPIPQIYEECREKIFEDLSVDEKKLLAADIPNFRSCQSGLYRHRRNFIPQAPTCFSDFDIHSDWVTQEELIVKDDYTLPDGGRILVFATNDTLKILANSKALSVDGTFKIAPKLWGQVMIICAQIAGGIWIPVLFALLPNKKKPTYNAFFQCVKNCLDKISETIAANFIMMDFETGMRDSWRSLFPDTTLKGSFQYLLICIV